MKKKFSTLIAGLLLAGTFPVATMAQFPGQKHFAYGLDSKAEIPYRTQLTHPEAFTTDYNHYGVRKIDETKWYQLEVTESFTLDAAQLDDNIVETKVLVQVRNYNTGELILKVVDQNALTVGTNAFQGHGSSAIEEPSLNSSLWKIEIVDRTPGAFMYTFTNKETGYQISYNCADAVNLSTIDDLPSSSLDKPTTIVKDGMKAWRWYTADENAVSDFNASKLYVFNHDAKKVLGFVENNDSEVVLVDIPYSQVTGEGQEMVGNYNILKFTIRNAGAHVLNAADINSMIDADNSWADRGNSALLAKFKEAAGFSGNVFFMKNYVAYDTEITDYVNTAATDYAGYSVVLQEKGTSKYFMVSTDSTYESNKLPTEHGGMVVLNATFDGDLTAAPMTALKARYHWKVTYYPTPDSLVLEPLNASYIASADKQAGRTWFDTPLEDATPAYYYNTVNAGFAHAATGAGAETNVPFNKSAFVPVALTLMNSTAGIDNNSVLTVGQPTNEVAAKHFKSTPATPAATHRWTLSGWTNSTGIFNIPLTHYRVWENNRWVYYLASDGTRGLYGAPVLTDVPAEMGLKVQFNHNYTYLTRSSVANDVYFIQVSVASANKTDYRKEGMYLVYNMEGRLMYDMPDDYQDYEQMPATQWVIERDTCDYYKTGANYVTISNREYGDKAPALFYGQLYQVPGTQKFYIINHQDYDVKSNTNGMFPNEYPILSCGDTIYFTPVKAETKANKYLGYKKFDHSSLKYETYAMKYLTANTLATPNTDYFLSIDETSSLLGVNAELWNDFEIDTLLVDQKFGYTSKKAGAVQLYRTNYALKVRDNNLIDNQWRYVVVNDDNNSNPYYQMNHLKNVDGKNVKLATFYFRLIRLQLTKLPKMRML